jgi:hypothetical protein
VRTLTVRGPVAWLILVVLTLVASWCVFSVFMLLFVAFAWLMGALGL